MYIVFEIQTNTDGTVGTLITTYENQNQAESAYHGILEAAAVSALPVHACTLLTEEGFQVRHECYKHPESPAVTQQLSV